MNAHRSCVQTSPSPIAATARGNAASTRPKNIFVQGELVSGSYEIRSVLGEGGMGQVYEAQDVALNRRVALKAAWPNVGAVSVGNEAKALAALRHPSIMTVH